MADLLEQVKLFLLGPFRAERAGDRLTGFKSDKVRALLAYLAIERDRAHPRDVLAGILWPKSSSSNALALLRDVLSNLRLTLGDRGADTPVIHVQRSRLMLNPSALEGDRLWMDVVAFTGSLVDGATEEELERAVAHYRGDFLEGFALADSPGFEEWALLQREVFQRRALDALYRLATRRLQRGDYEAAQIFARRQLTLNPYSEEATRQLLRALAFAGERNQALAHYADYAALLDEKLGVIPDVRTRALCRRIREGRLRPLVPSPSSHFTETLLAPASDAGRDPFVGRDEQLRHLEAAWQSVQQGESRLMLLTGAAGSGKTTLVQAFAQRILSRGDDVVVARGTCNAQIGAGDPYLAFREILRLLTAEFDVPGDNRALGPAYAQRLERIAPDFVRCLACEGPDLVGRLVALRPEFQAWVGSSFGEAPPAQRARQSQVALCDQITRVLRAFSRDYVLTLVLDDLHWADTGTLNLLAHLGRRMARSRVLLIGAYRPAEVAPTHPLADVVHELQRTRGDIILDLNRAGTRDFVNAYVDSAPNTLDNAFRARLTEQTGGHALFTAALVKQMRDDGTLEKDDQGRWQAPADLDWSRMPPRVEAVIAKRLSRLSGSQQELLAVASVEGEVFTAEVVAAVRGQSQKAVERALSALGEGQLHGLRHRLVQPLGLADGPLRRTAEGRLTARYRFRHGLFQRYVYDCLDRVERMRLHEAVGQALEKLYAGRHDDVAGQLAYHFEAAGLLGPAVDYLVQAGKRAYRLSAPVESIRLYRRASELLEELPASRSRDRREMEVLLNLEEALMTTRGWGAPERAASLERAYHLGQRLGETEQLLPILRALVSVTIARADHRTAMSYAEQLLGLAQETSNDLYDGVGRRMSGTVHFFMGHSARAHEDLTAGLRTYAASLSDNTLDRALAAEEDVRLRVWLSLVLLVRGYPTQAMSMSDEALTRAEALGYVGVQGIALTTAGTAFYALCRKPRPLLRYARRLSNLSREHILPSYRGWATSYRGWAQICQRKVEEGLSQMRTGLEQLQSTGTGGSVPQLLTFMAEAYAELGEIRQGENAINRALTLAAATGARSHLAEMHRVRGVLYVKGAAFDETEDAFTRAIDVAREQGTRLWELRATLSLARLWRARGQAAEAHARLSEIYGWFTEGFDIPDLVAARAFLNRSSTG